MASLWLWTAFTIRQEDPKKWDAVPVRNLNWELFYEIQSRRQRFLLYIMGWIFYALYIYIFDVLGLMLIEIKFRFWITLKTHSSSVYIFLKKK